MSNATSSSKQKATKLREKGLSYNEISKKLNVAKSTLSGWLKDLPISKTAKSKNINNAKKVWARNITLFNKKRSADYQKRVTEEQIVYSREIKNITKRDLFWLGLGLFLAEGGKREKWAVRFTNSDSVIIKAIMRFFRETCGVTEDKFRPIIYLHHNCDSRKSLIYWSKIASIPEEQFYNPQTIVSGRSQGKRPIHRLPYGTVRISISDAKLNRRIKGWILGLSQQIENR